MIAINDLQHPSPGQPRFPLGQTVATPGAIAAMKEAKQDAAALFQRHQSGDWGEVGEEDARLNEAAVEEGSRIMSVYVLSSGEKVWIITEADRSATTILLPDEY